jgi:hypothetical protein
MNTEVTIATWRTRLLAKSVLAFLTMLFIASKRDNGFFMSSVSNRYFLCKVAKIWLALYKARHVFMWVL